MYNVGTLSIGEEGKFIRNLFGRHVHVMMALFLVFPVVLSIIMAVIDFKQLHTEKYFSLDNTSEVANHPNYMSGIFIIHGSLRKNLI